MKDEQKNEFDFVIVGAGASSMGLLLGLLTKAETKVPTFTIAVIERGHGPPHSPTTMSPKDWPDAATTPSSSVTLLTTTIGNRVVEIPTGSGLGGSTNINACLCTPPASADFEVWPDPWKTSMMGSVKSIINIMFDNEAVVRHETSVPSMLSILESNADLMEPLGNSLWTEALYPQLVTNLQFTASKTEGGKFTRKNYHEALIEPLLNANFCLKSCISWYKNTEAQRLLFKGDCTTGVECYSKREGIFNIYAKREVIICAGAFESAALLLVSGLGRDEDLDKAGIKAHMKGSAMGVGQNLMDHPIIPKIILTQWTSYSQSPNTIQALMQLSCGENRFQMALTDSACLTQLAPYILANQFRRKFESEFLTRLTDVLVYIMQFVFRVVIKYGPIYYISRHCTFGMNVKLMNPKSKGNVWLKRKQTRSSSEPLRRKDVIVNVNSCYLTDVADIEALQKGWILCHKYCNAWLQQGIEVLPGKVIKDAFGTDWFRHFAINSCLPYFHWCGTCSMEIEGRVDWVVTSSLKVRNLKGLRVCDASVFPSTITGPTGITCAAMGFEFASILLNDSTKKTV